MTGHVRQITRCEICGNSELNSVLDLGKHPMCDDLVEIGDDRQCIEYPIEILFCDRCISAHQRFQIPKHELFPPSYHYRSRHTADVLEGMKQLVTACVDEVGPLAGAKVLDVGCNDGSLLSFFRDAGVADTYGIEPTGAAEDASAGGHIVVNDFLTESVAESFVDRYGRPDIVTFTNVFAHIEDLPSLVRSIRKLMHDTTTIVIENHYLGSVIERRQFDTFYHEHPRTYSYTSLAFVADALSRKITKAEFPKRYGGNIRVMLRRAHDNVKHDQWDEAHAAESSFGAALVAMAKEIERWKISKRVQLESAIRQGGKLPAKAFPGRSAIPIKLLNLGEDLISAVFEKPTSSKIGHFVPGTRIPILSDDEFDAKSVKGPVLNLAWHIADEIRLYMRGRGYHGEFINIISPSDFGEPG